jgi:glutamyl/glutaminyl-tRNA synthetase
MILGTDRKKLSKREAFEKVESWTAQDLDAALRQLAAEMKVSASRLIHPVRLALTGVTVGAPLFDVVALLEKETALRRLRKFVEGIRRDNRE